MEQNLTGMLDDWAHGDRTALARLAPIVYPQLRQLAGAYLRGERSGHTWQATALVNELFLKLIARREARFESRRHFYALCAKVMRTALIDHARSVNASKRGGEFQVVPLHDEMQWINAAGPDVLDLDRALDELAELDPEQAQMFESRFVLGCTTEETAEMLETSVSTVDRKVRLARGWLYQRLRAGAGPAAP